ncbi:MAG: MBL fold metallo-hydrolase [Actinobacteria bacterium]|nr:MBL fold metallo-hydrolase [Actinomycetota bacterium]
MGSGSSGNSVFIGSSHTKILIDAGFSLKELTQRLLLVDAKISEIDAVFITHEHIDHVSGAGLLSRISNIPVFANISTWDAIGGSLGDLHPRIFPQDKGFHFRDFYLEPFSVSHDSAMPVGFTVNHKKFKIGMATDLGFISQPVIEKLKGSDVLILETNHDLKMLNKGSYPELLKKRIRSNCGHLSNTEAANALSKLKNGHKQNIFLSHISRENNTPFLALSTVRNKLGYKENNKDFFIHLTHQDKISDIIELTQV